MTYSPDTLTPFSVTELSHRLKALVENQFSHLQVRGEISGCKYHASGHVYLALKDDKSVLDGVCWRGTVGRLPLKPQDGMEVIATGRLTTYPGRSKYQLVIEDLLLAGEGALLKLLEERRRQLAQEGLFEASRKQRLPTLPRRIGLITSPTGAVIQDILHRLAERCPRPVLLWPVAVQGEGASEQIVAALDGFNALPSAIPKPDVLIVARGGGSLEDLWAFNEEKVVRAVARSSIPVISGVGHEPDMTLIDYVADYRAPTPTAAAERAVPVKRDLLRALDHQGHRLQGSLMRLVQEAEQRLDDRTERFAQAPRFYLNALTHRTHSFAARLRTPQESLTKAHLQLSSLLNRLHTSCTTHLTLRTHHLSSWISLLDSYSYTATLKRGFAMVERQKGGYLKRATHAKKNEVVRLVFADGARSALITEGSSPAKKASPSPADSRQPTFWS